jgi:hypothetical protein
MSFEKAKPSIHAGFQPSFNRPQPHYTVQGRLLKSSKRPFSFLHDKVCAQATIISMAFSVVSPSNCHNWDSSSKASRSINFSFKGRAAHWS